MRLALALLAFASILLGVPDCGAAEKVRVTVVALGASQTYGKGVPRGDAYPAQLELLLRARGHDVTVANEGRNGNTTTSLLRRFDDAVPEGTKLVLLQPGTNDEAKGRIEERAANIAEIERKCTVRGIKLIRLTDDHLSGMPRQPDGQHLTREGYRMLAEKLLPEVERALAQ